jgi:hypothetical protein
MQREMPGPGSHATRYGVGVPGMNSGPSASSLALMADFRAVLLAEGTVMFLLFVLLAIGWVACREMLLVRARAWLAAQRGRWPAEPTGRRVLRIGFGVLWIVDGLLQAQPGMPAGLTSQVITPAAAGSPGWVAHIVNFGTQIWSGDPVEAAAGAVWLQLGIGIWLVSVSTPRWSRLAGLVSVVWGLVVWVFGEAFGGLLGPSASWLTGAPGAALFYCAAGVLLALPARNWRDPQLGRRILLGAGALLAAGAVLQAWPGRGFWQGTLPGAANARLPGPLASAIGSMAQASQPAAVHNLVGWFAAVVAGHGFAVNLVAVVMLAAAGTGLLTGRREIIRPVGGAVIGFCLADWVLVQDFGIFGGLGTDPNSMLPQAIILATGLLVVAARPVPVAVPAGTPASANGLAPLAPVIPARGRLAVLQPGSAVRRLGFAFGTASASAVLAVWAVVMVLLLGAAPMAIAAAHRGSGVAASASACYRPMLASAVPNADCHAAADLAGPGGTGLVRSSAASAHRVTSAGAGEVTMASPSSS